MYEPPPEDVPASLNNSTASVKSKRGRKKIPDMWTRLISFSDDDLENLRVFELAPDLLLGNAMKETKTRGKQAAEW